MVVDMIMDLLDTRWYAILAGLALLVLGIAGLQAPQTWAFNTGMVGQLFGVLPDVVHQVLAGLFALGGITQIMNAL